MHGENAVDFGIVCVFYVCFEEIGFEWYLKVESEAEIDNVEIGFTWHCICMCVIGRRVNLAAGD